MQDIASFLGHSATLSGSRAKACFGERNIRIGSLVSEDSSTITLDLATLPPKNLFGTCYSVFTSKKIKIGHDKKNVAAPKTVP